MVDTRDAPGPSQEPSADVPTAREARNRLRDDNEHLEMQLPGGRRFLRLIWRALTLRCPHCGKGPVRETWFRMRPECGACGRPLERGESDYWIGALLFNLILAELIFAIAFVGTLVAMWPRVPWTGIQWAAPIGMALTPLLTFPVSKLLWLAFDLSIRPDSDTPS